MGLLLMVYWWFCVILEFGRDRLICLHLEGFKDNFQFLVHSANKLSSFWSTLYRIEFLEDGRVQRAVSSAKQPRRTKLWWVIL